MGIFMDTIEDNFERIGIYSDKNWEWNGTQIISRLHYCPICSAACASEFEVQDHMFRNHRHYQAYVKVNGKVITKDSFINEPINRIEIHYVGLQYIEGSWKNGETKGSFIAKSDEPFLLYPSQKLPVISDVIEITLGQGRQNMIFSIVQTHNSSLQYEQMEYLFFEYQDTYLRSRDKFLWSSFRNAFQHLSKNSI
ncbi:hypothetical protein [Paenibacillus sp. V4I5]|uniref:hypothetical protein n=1 Tax=Paenibacillus sp. V4I5 TaxID=3042306 RepID=UPI00278FBC7D|nr:hypothetical protein [Paenibacillus sp. V4I5]MDQ0917558.1 hypothetical protein [Paenibacillus sp. V4I5]